VYLEKKLQMRIILFPISAVSLCLLFFYTLHELLEQIKTNEKFVTTKLELC